MSIDTNVDATVATSRVFPFSADRLFEAFARPDLLARWWGPEGFTNTFERFEFHVGGRWVFVMHGPNGVDYPNESVFRELVPARRVVIEHVVAPVFTLTVTLTPTEDGTRLTWEQVFESAAFVAPLRGFLETANGQNLDRLGALLDAEH